MQLLALGFGIYQHVRFVDRAHGLRRAAVAAYLESQPGQHLVLVRYSDDHLIHDEWINNRAEIDESRVVWARAFEDQRDRMLLDYFHERSVWRLDADADIPRPTRQAMQTHE